MRIVGGRWRGRSLAPVGQGDAAGHLRPTSDRTREAIFNILFAMGDPVTGARVLDIFAGTGALGLEALSRGARHATFIEKGRAGAALVAANTALCGAGDRTSLLRRDATRPGRPNAPHDLVFLDPPYGTDLGRRAVEVAMTGGWLSHGALIVWEDGAPPQLPPDLTEMDRRRYGDTHLTIARYDM